MQEWKVESLIHRRHHMNNFIVYKGGKGSLTRVYLICSCVVLCSEQQVASFPLCEMFGSGNEARVKYTSEVRRGGRKKGEGGKEVLKPLPLWGFF